MTKRLIRAADLFCGAGGTSTGLANACAELGLALDLIAVNHWQIAISTHSRNHPAAKHLCARLEAVEPRDHVPSGRLDLLLASPECTHHSRARGGKPMSDQSRASAWLVLKWLQELYVETFLVENVLEFEDWGPLGANGKPLKSKRGQLFHAWLTAIRALGYTVETKRLNAADFGEATTRERLFVIGRRGKRRIPWPEPTHARDPQPVLFGVTKTRWRPAREIIDWSVPGQSIFQRKRPLKIATLERIAAGLRKFRWPEPFLVILRRHMNAISVDDPLPSLTAGGQHVGLCQPFVLGQQSGSVPRSTEDPLPTIAGGGAISLVQSFLTCYRGNHAGRSDGNHRNRPLDEPLPTQDTANRFGLVQPFMVPFFGERDGQAPRTHSIDAPLPAVTSHGAGALVQPFVMPVNHGGKDKRSYSISDPFPTITSVDAWSVVSPFIVQYYGTGQSDSLDEPLSTVTTRDRFGIVTPDTVAIDILFRMLQPHELAAAMGYEGYEFSGTREQKVKQIGNGVSRRLAQALCRQLLTDKAMSGLSREEEGAA